MRKIAVDIDEVCNNLMESVLAVYNSRHNTSYTLDDCVEFDLGKSFPQDVAAEMYDLFGSEEVRSILQPTDGVQWGIETLINLGYQVCFATATTPNNFGWKVDWMLKYFPLIDSKQIINIANKGWLNVDILIDDNSDNLKAGLYERICLDRPWNRNIRDDIYDIYRCNSWREIINVINEIERKQEEWK